MEQGLLYRYGPLATIPGGGEIKINKLNQGTIRIRRTLS